MNEMPEVRRGKLRKLLQRKEYIRVLEASNGLSGLIVENTVSKEREFDAMWISSLCDSVLKGKPDNEVVDFSQRLQTVQEILEVTTKPVIFDGDTGGCMQHFVSRVKTLEQMGVSAIIIEDKKGLKQNSLKGDPQAHILEDAEVFAEKIRNGKEALQTRDFMIFARIESFVAGKDLQEALRRAQCYVEAGADGIMIHSYQNDGREIISFLEAFKKKYPKVITIVVPTTYAFLREEELKQYGANVIIYANHLLRSAYKAMQQTARKILEDGCAKEAGELYCVSVKEILELVEEG